MPWGFGEKSLSKYHNFFACYRSWFWHRSRCARSNAELVISHDYATKDSPRLIELLREVNETQNMIALNIKSDGIFLELKSILDNLNIQNYFCFDMSIPQQVQYQRNGLNWYSRISDQIEERSVNQASMGIWLDAFDHDWWSKDC